jgi:rubrerythrin
MSAGTGWWSKFQELLGIGSNGGSVQELLSRRYVSTRRYARQLAYHAERMQYPHFREKLGAIAADANKHCNWIAEKLRELGGVPPDVAEVHMSDKNSWRFLLEDLEEQRREAAELLIEISALKDRFPDVATMLQRVYEESVKHREEIRSMLMRSDPQAYLAP